MLRFVMASLGGVCFLTAIAVMLWPLGSENVTSNSLGVTTSTETVSGASSATPSPSIPPDGKTVPVPAPVGPPLQGTAADVKLGATLRMSSPLSGEQLEGFLQELIGEVNQGAPRLELTRRAQALLRELAGHGKHTASTLLEEYRKPGRPGASANTRNAVIVNALTFMGSEEAKAALLELALTADPNGYRESSAAEAYALLAKSPEELAKLLSSTAEGPRIIGAQKLAGLPLDAKIAESLAEQLDSKSPQMHVAVAEAFGKDPADDTAPRKIEHLLENAGKIDSLDKSDKIGFPGPWTYGERVFLAFNYALSGMPGGEAPLRERLLKAAPAQREMIVIALANRGSVEMHDELIRIIKETQLGIVRMAAVKALSKTATLDDAALLRQLAESDPFHRRGDVVHTGPNPPYEIQEYPVRDAASSILRRLERKSPGK